MHSTHVLALKDTHLQCDFFSLDTILKRLRLWYEMKLKNSLWSCVKRSLPCPMILRAQMSRSTVIGSGCSGLWKAEQTEGDRQQNDALLCERLRWRRGEPRWPYLHSTLLVPIVGADRFVFHCYTASSFEITERSRHWLQAVQNIDTQKAYRLGKTC